MFPAQHSLKLTVSSFYTKDNILATAHSRLEDDILATAEFRLEDDILATANFILETFYFKINYELRFEI